MKQNKSGRILVATHHIPYTCHLVTPALPAKASALQRASSKRYLNAASFKDYNNFVQYGGSNLISQSIGGMAGCGTTGAPILEESAADVMNGGELGLFESSNSSYNPSPLNQTPARSVNSSPVSPERGVSDSASSLNRDALNLATAAKANESVKSGSEYGDSSLASTAGNPHTTTSSGITWKFSTRRGHSAMYSGIRNLSPSEQIVLFGYTGTIFDDAENALDYKSLSDNIKSSLAHQLSSNLSCYPVFMEEKVASGHYDNYCKTDLWPLFHYILWDNNNVQKLQDQNFWDEYVAANQAFADALVHVYRPGDIIWVHDYHLLLVPSMVRVRCPDAIIGFFLHTPFPSSELFRCLPRRREILEGVLRSDIIGFQTYSYARHFTSSCTRVLGLESNPKGVEFNGSVVQVGIYPIGIDVERVQLRRQSALVNAKIKALREKYAGKKVIIGRDKLDYIKGVQHKLCAFEKFLQAYPEWHNNVVLIQVTSPAALRTSSRLESKVSEIVSRINSQFGSLEFSPVVHIHQNLDQDEYCALLSTADVGLITSVRDGMNTTSHEFVVCQQDNHGVLILSEFTGTAGSLSAAILVNPFDYTGVAGVIKEALEMTREEKFNKHQQLYDHVTRHTAQFWAKSFIKDLRLISRHPEAMRPTPCLDDSLFLQKYERSVSRLLLFDYDGTLTPIVKTPTAALPSPEMKQALATLAADPKNEVFIISGRDQEALDKWLGDIPNLGMSAEHGCFIKYPEDPELWINLSEDLDFSWKQDVLKIFEYYTERTQGSSVELKRSSITWHYRLADPEFGEFQAKECQNHLENAILSKRPVEILVGKKCLEVRPISISKGEIVKRLLTQRVQPLDFVFCVGDDKTDEDMFKMIDKVKAAQAAFQESDHSSQPPVLREGSPVFENIGAIMPSNGTSYFSCIIGPPTKRTSASFHLLSPNNVIKNMQQMASISKKDMEWR